MTEKLIFISCGQQSIDEKEIGGDVRELINSHPGYKAYFAEYVNSLDALAKNVFEGLRRCSGFISFLHERGLVTIDKNQEWGYRSSVWINQEIAILSYRQQFEGINIPVLVFKDNKVRIEGAMTSLIVNPIPMKSKIETLNEIRRWIESTEFPLPSMASDERFLSKWQKLSPKSYTILCALIDEGGKNVKESAIRNALMEKYGMSNNEASSAISAAQPEFITTDIVKSIPNLHSGDEMSINPTWEWHIAREIRKLM